MPDSETPTRKIQVANARPEDSGRGLAHLPRALMATLGIGEAVLAEAALSFLGLGIRPPAPSWGNMLTDAREAIRSVPWATIFPGLAVFVTVLGFNLLGDGVRDWLDPRMQVRA